MQDERRIMTGEISSHLCGLLPSAFRQTPPKLPKGRKWQRDFVLAVGAVVSVPLHEVDERIIPFEGIHVKQHMPTSFGQDRGRKDMSSIQLSNTSYSGRHAVRH